MRSLLPFLLVILTSCGQNGPQTQEGPDTVLDSLGVKFEPATGSILVTGMLRSTTTTLNSITGEGEFFYLSGRIPGSDPLKSLAGDQSALPTCRNPQCTSFTLPLKLSHLSLTEPVSITIRVPRNVRASTARRADPSAQPFSEAWKEILDRGVEAARSSIAAAEWRKHRFLSAYAEGNPSSKTRWLLASVRESDEKFSINYVTEPAQGPIFILTTETGRLDASDKEWSLGFAGGKLIFEIRAHR